MSRDPRPPKAPWLTPYLTVRDAGAALDFYQRAFGFEPGEVASDEHGKVMHCEMRYRDQLVVMFAPEGAFGGSSQAPRSLGVIAPQVFYVYCDDVDAIYQRARAAGAIGEVEPADQFWGDRMGSVVDPDGYRWAFACHLG
jgi:uncharacterized glyoxalase superfamily protein PhnB